LPQFAATIVSISCSAFQFGASCCSLSSRTADELADAWRLLADHGGAGRQRKLATEQGLDELAEWLVEETERPSPQAWYRLRSIPERETGQRLPRAACRVGWGMGHGRVESWRQQSDPSLFGKPTRPPPLNGASVLA
jgi:hypothetical protein